MDDRRPAAARRFTRLLPSVPLDGVRQMAIDAWLLGRGGPALRLYRWRRPCLSLGRHQRRLDPVWLRLAAGGVIDLVRRPSGGGAVLHGSDLTYALVWPDPPADRVEAYRLACRWIQVVFEDLGQPLEFGDEPATLGGASCFATRTAADLVHRNGAKRVGSAQLWRGGRLLQHGSIQISPPVELWRRVFDQEPPPLPALPVALARLEHRLLAAAGSCLPLPPLRIQRLRAGERAAIAAELSQFRIDPAAGAGGACTAASTSPEASIERTT